MPSLVDYVGLRAPQVSVTIDQEQFFVTPSPDPAFPSDDPNVRGTVLIDLPSAKAIKAVRVTLEGACDAWTGQQGKYESSTTLRKTLDIDLNGEVLQAGKHAFTFSFVLPSSTAVYQRCNYGRVRHWIKACVEYDGALGMTSSISSTPVSIFVVANPLGPGQLPEPLELELEHFDQDLGPVGIALSSPHFTIASLLSLRIVLASTPDALTICSARGYILQNFEIHLQDGTVTKMPTQELRLMPISRGDDGAVTPDSSLVDFIDRGDCWRFSRTMRVPDDDSCRPSTLPGSEGRIRVSHRLQVRVRYQRNGEKETRQLTITKPVVMQSCCTAEALTYLPAYTRKAPKTTIRPVISRCLCKVDLKEVYDRDGELLERAGVLDVPDSSRLLAYESGNDKSPAWTSLASLPPAT